MPSVFYSIIATCHTSINASHNTAIDATIYSTIHVSIETAKCSTDQSPFATTSKQTVEATTVFTNTSTDQKTKHFSI